MSRKAIWLLTTLAVLITAQVAQAGDWPMFRHDATHSGVADDIISPPLKLLWNYTRMDGSSISSPAVSDGVVFIGSGDVNIYALDAATGSLKWKYPTGSSVGSSPTISNGIVYVGSHDTYIYALDAATGALKWRYKTRTSIFSSPVVSSGLVYLNHESYIYAIDTATGTLKWNYRTDGDRSSPAISGGILYVGSKNNYTYALDAATGVLKWKYKTEGPISSSPTVSGSIVYVGSGDGNVYALDAATGALKWKYPTGAQIFYSSPAVSGGIVYIGSDDTYVYALDAATGVLKWKYKTGNEVFSSPAVSGNVVYVVSRDGYLYALDAATGALRWNAAGGGLSSPAISGGILYVGSVYNVYAFAPMPAPTPTPTPTPTCPLLAPPLCPNGTIISQGIDPNTGCQKPSICVIPTTTPTTGSIAISSTPSGASIYLDGVYKGTTPKLLTDVLQGSHKIKLTLSGYDDWSNDKLVATGVASRLSAELTTSIPAPAPVQIAAATPAPVTTMLPSQLLTQPPTKPLETQKSVPVEAILVSIVGAIIGIFPLRTLLISDSKDSPKYRVERSLVSYYLVAGHIILGGFFLWNFYWFTIYAIPGKLMPPDEFLIPVLFSLIFLYASFSSFTLAYGAFKLKPLNKTAIFHILLSLFIFLLSFFYYLNDFPEGLFVISSIVLPSIALSIWQIRITKSIEIGEPLLSVDSTPTPTIKEPVMKEEMHKKGINVASAFGYKGPAIIYKVKIENNISEPISDIKVHLFVPEVFVIKEKEKPLSILEPKESKTVTFEIRPTGECGDCNVSGKIEYYDYNTRKRKILDIEAKTISVVCPVLKRKEIDVKQWEQITDGLIKAEENIKELYAPAENLFNIISRVTKDNGMFMLKPEITSTPQLFNGFAMFYAEGVTGLRYAAYIEVVGGARRSRLILKVWAEKEEALTGFYHKILDDIEKRTDVKIFIDDAIVQQIQIGDRIGTQVKESFVQRSNIGAGARKCPNCGRELESNEKFCQECGARL